MSTKKPSIEAMQSAAARVRAAEAEFNAAVGHAKGLSIRVDWKPEIERGPKPEGSSYYSQGPVLGKRLVVQKIVLEI